MSILETTLIFVVIPVLILLALYVFARITATDPAPRPEPYTLDRTWNHAPILWSATDEVTPYTHHAGANTSGHAELTAGSASLIGGRASGKW